MGMLDFDNLSINTKDSTNNQRHHLESQPLINRKSSIAKLSTHNAGAKS
jgi:hypothetical protein